MHFCLVNVSSDIKYLHHTIFTSTLCVPQYRWLRLSSTQSSGRCRLNKVYCCSFISAMSKIKRIISERLIHPIKALCILNGNMQFLPQLLERLIRWQVQAIEAFKKKSMDKRGITIQIKYTGSFENLQVGLIDRINLLVVIPNIGH